MARDKIRVLHISKYYHPFSGGTELVARQCVRALQESVHQEYEQAVFCFDHKGMKGSFAGERSEDSVDLVDGVRVVRCACEAKISSQSISFSFRRRLRAVFQQFEPDVVILHYPNPFATHYLMPLLKPKQKLMIFWHLDIVKQRILRKLFIGQNRCLIDRADCIIATSPNYIEGSQWLRQYREKCVVIPNCIDEKKLEDHLMKNSQAVDRVRQRYQEKILCLAVGRHVEYKGFRYLIEAAQYLDERFTIVMMGAGPLTEKLKQQAKELENHHDNQRRKSASVAGSESIERADSLPDIIFAGLVSDEELRNYLYACDIFCFPSITKNEAFGIALAEAMYCGKPAVTFTIEGSGVNYVSPGGVTGLECPNRDSRAYAAAMRLLADRPDLREQYGRAAKKRVEELFLYRQFSKHIQELLQELTTT